MLRTIKETDCDKCLKKNVSVKEIRLETCRDLDPAGGPAMPGGIEFDLCIDCLAGIVRQIQDQASHEVNKEFVNKFDIKQKREW